MRLRLPCLSLVLAAALAACAPAPGDYTGGRVDELRRVDLVEGEGTIARAGDEVVVHYTGWLYVDHAPDQRGEKFDSSLDRGDPFRFTLGQGRVIRGWDDGVAGMRVGGRRVLLIPPEFAYGARGAGRAIPPYASLVFEVELIEVRGR